MKKIIILGAAGRLGSDLVSSFSPDEFDLFGFNRAELDITDARKLRGD